MVYDGFITSHQKRRIQVFDDPEAVRGFLGERPDYPSPLDTEHPATFGPYMNDPDLINNKVQLSQAMEAARRVIPEVFAELAALTGRDYAGPRRLRMEDAEAAVVLLNSSAETAKEAVDKLRAAGRKVGVLSPNVLRPFPAREFREALRGVKAVTIGDRADSYGADGGNLSLEVRAALQVDPRELRRRCSRASTAWAARTSTRPTRRRSSAQAARGGARAGRVKVPFAYHGATPGKPGRGAEAGPRRRSAPEDVSRGMAKVTPNELHAALEVELQPLWKMTSQCPMRIAPGHGACPGCGAFPTFHQIFNVLEGDIVVLFQTGCAMVVTTGYPSTAHRINYIHNLFQNGAATLSGLVEMYHERVRRGELPPVEGHHVRDDLRRRRHGHRHGRRRIGAANRNHRMMILEYDNQGYMNTGAQLSYSTPFGHRTSTSEVGATAPGKRYHHKDTAQIFAACHLPYVFTASEGYPEDLMRKVAKAQWYAKNEGLVYGKILSFCPLNWRTADDAAEPVLQAAIDSCFFPLYEVEHGHTTLTYDPEASGRRIPVADWLKLMGKTRHLVKPENAAARGRRRRPRPTVAGPASRRCTSIRSSRPEKAMAKIIETRRLTPVTKYFRIEAPLIAASARPGQFVMLRVREGGERIPITIADYDRAARHDHHRRAGGRRDDAARVRARDGRRDPRRGRPASAATSTSPRAGTSAASAAASARRRSCASCASSRPAATRPRRSSARATRTS